MKGLLSTQRRDWRSLTGRQAFLCVALFQLFLSVAFIYSPRTAFGKHCPTAPVQTVKVESCCQTKVETCLECPTKRTLQPGDEGFVQCRCAEKKQAGQEYAAVPKIDLYCAATAAPVFPFPYLRANKPLPSQAAAPQIGYARSIEHPPAFA